MNYVNNFNAAVCCGVNDREKIQISEIPTLIDCESGKELSVSSTFTPGHNYRCENRWVLMETYTPLATFATKDEALAAYKKIVDGLKENNTVIDI